MEDFSVLATRVAANVGEVRGCVIVSRDGLELGSFPEGDGGPTKPAWLRFAALGDAEKGFVQFGDELWAYARRGPYAAFAVCEVNVRPGLVLDQMEQALLSAEELRAKRDSFRLPETPPAPSGKPRTSLHRDVKAPAPQPAAVRQEPVGAQAGGPPPIAAGGGAQAAGRGGEPQAAEAPEPPQAVAPAAPPAAAPAVQPPAPSEPADGATEAEEDLGGEVDRVLLAQEFSRLLQETQFDDEDEA